MIDVELYLQIRARMTELDHGADYAWAQSVKPPATAEALACEYTWVVLNSGMRNTVAQKIMDRVWPVLAADRPIAPVFGHKGKVSAIERMWSLRAGWFYEFQRFGVTGNAACDGGMVASAVIDWCDSLPWIGKITKYHLAKNLGVDCAKPDRWLVRLADASGETVDDLCARLARATGDRVATVDVVLWRACAVGELVVDAAGVRLRS